MSGTDSETRDGQRDAARRRRRRRRLLPTVLKLSLSPSPSFRNSHFTNSKLKVVCSVLDLEKKGTHSDLVDRILGFLVAPKNSGKVSEPVDCPRR